MKRCVRSERVYECVRARYHVLMRIMVIMISRVSVAGGDSAPRPLYIVPLVGTLNWCSSACTDRLQNYYRMFIHRYTHTEISEHRPTAIKATHIELCSSCGRRRLILHLIQNCNKWFYYRNDLQSQTSVVQRYIYIYETSNGRAPMNDRQHYGTVVLLSPITCVPCNMSMLVNAAASVL